MFEPCYVSRSDLKISPAPCACVYTCVLAETPPSVPLWMFAIWLAASCHLTLCSAPSPEVASESCHLGASSGIPVCHMP